MKKFLFLFITAIILITYSCGKRNDFQENISLNKDWEFSLETDSADSINQIDSGSWKKLDLPHDWAIEHPVSETNPGDKANGFFRGGTGWYRKNLFIPDNYINKAVSFQFEGIYRNADIWINGNHAANQKYGYSEIIIDADTFLQYGKENLIEVRVENIEPMDRWYHGCGIYRDVNMIVANKVHIPLHGTFIRNEVFDSLDAQIRITTELINENPDPVEVMLVSHVFHPREGKTAVAASERFLLRNDTSIEQLIDIEIPDMWSPDNPVVYDLVSDILTENNTILDTYISHFGIRKAEFIPAKGFVLNWKKTALKGVCIHHDLGVSGSAFYPSLMRTRLLKLKECGVNSIRLSHNPHETELLEMCDEMGFIVIDELFDKWETSWYEHSSDPVKFMETWEKDAEMFIRRDRNHPCNVIWSVGNETMEQLKDPERGVEILKMLISRFKKLDPSREVTCALHPHGELPSRLMNETKVVSYNYQVEKFHDWKKEYPDKVFLGSETKVFQEGTVKDYSRPDFSKNTWFMLEPGDAGQYIWAGIDYFGESRGWPDKGIRTGFINSAAFIKPYGQFTRSIYSEEPFVSITVLDPEKLEEINNLKTWQKIWYGPPLSSHWNWNQDSVDLYIFTNEAETEIFLNEKSLGKFLKANYPAGVISLKVPYEKGNIKAVTTTHNKTDELKTSSEPAALKLILRDYQQYKQDDNLYEVEVYVCDKNGTPCPVKGINIHAEFPEDITFIGADNGDMSDHTLLGLPERKTLDGKCLFVFKNEGLPREVIFSARGLREEKLLIGKIHDN